MVGLDALTRRLTPLADQFDLSGDWPGPTLDALSEAGVWGWTIQGEFGGSGRGPTEILAGYEAIGRGCLTTLLILTQRDTACELIAASEAESLKQEILPRLARGEIMTTVGISQLTTSHQTGPPAMTVTPSNGGYRFRGYMPWASGAARSEIIVTGGVLPNGQQLLVAMPTNLPGVEIGPPLSLLALQSSWTSRVNCRDVQVNGRYVLRGPVDKALGVRLEVRPMVVPSTGIALAAGLIDALDEYRGTAPPEINRTIEPLLARHAALRDRLYDLSRTLGRATREEVPIEIRVEVNDVVVKLALALLVYAKGSGYQTGRRANRLLREAMFFLVWAATDPIRAGTLARLLG